MKITIDSIEIDDVKFKTAVIIEGDIHRWDKPTYGELGRSVIAMIVEKITEDYLTKHTHEIMNKIDQQQIINRIVLSTARKMVDA